MPVQTQFAYCEQYRRAFLQFSYFETPQIKGNAMEIWQLRNIQPSNEYILNLHNSFIIV